MECSKKNQDVPSQTRVLIVGGGPVGLTASALLSQHGIPKVVVERRQQAQHAPAAHVLRPRSMQVFERTGSMARRMPFPNACEPRWEWMTDAERAQLEQAIEAQRSHFLSEGRLPADPRTAAA